MIILHQVKQPAGLTPVQRMIIEAHLTYARDGQEIISGSFPFRMWAKKTENGMKAVNSKGVEI
jgi:hypothetical protein